MKKYIAILLVVCFMFMLMLGGCKGSDTDASSSSNGTSSNVSSDNTSSADDELKFTPPENYASVVQIVINPTVNLYLDENEVIIAVQYVNIDAKECLSKVESTLLGKELKEGVNTVIATANADGYLAENKKVTVDVVETKEADKKLDILTDIKESAKTYMTENSIDAEVGLTEAVQQEIDDKIAAEKDKKNPIKNLKKGVEYGIIKPGETEEMLTGLFIKFKDNGEYSYGKAPYILDEYGEGESIVYNGKTYYLAGGGGGGGTYTMTDEKITMSGAYDMEFTMTADGKLVVAKADSTSDFFVVGDLLTIM